MEMCIDKVLFVTMKYEQGIPDRGLVENSRVMFLETLAQSQLIKEIRILFYDEIAQKATAAGLGEHLIHESIRYQPDLIIFDPSGLSGLDPPRNAFDILTNTFKFKTCMLRGDSVGDEGHYFQSSWFPFLSHIVFFDTTISNLGYKNNPKAIQLIVSAGSNKKYFYPRDQLKDIDVSFIGKLDAPNRKEYIEYFRQNGINVHHAGGEKKISWGEYASLISRSKISLNFCLNGCGVSNMKGRVIETMACKTFLLEDEGTETKMFFDEGKEFIMVKSKEEMLNKINYYLEHEDERNIIAEAGYDKVNKLYNVKNTWGYVFHKMGFKLPDDFIKNPDYQNLRVKLEGI